MKPKHTAKRLLPITIAALAAFLLAACGKPEKTASTGAPAAAKSESKSAVAKEYTPAAKTKIASLGKTIKNTRLVYYFDNPFGREYTVIEYENDHVKREWEHVFYLPKYDHEYKPAVKHKMENNMLKETDKDEAALWYCTQRSHLSKKTWQKNYDWVKSMKTCHIVE